MSERRRKVFRIATKLAIGHALHPAWYYRNVIRLHRILNNQSPFQSDKSYQFFETPIGAVRVL